MSAELPPFGTLEAWLREVPDHDQVPLRTGLRLLLDGSMSFDLPAIDRRIAAIDEALYRQLDLLLHHPIIHHLEARWRGIADAVDHLETAEGVRIELLATSVEELALDFRESPEFTHSGLYTLVYTRALATYGGAPYGLLCGDFASGPQVEDLELLRAIAKVAAAAQVPFVGSAAPALLGLTEFSELPTLGDLEAALVGATGRRWQALRRDPHARYLGLALPRFLLRAPHTIDDRPSSALHYHETITTSNDLLWGHASVAFAVRVAQAFDRYRWCVSILGSEVCGVIELNLPRRFANASVDLLISRPLEGALAREGLLAMVYDRRSRGLTFHSAPSLAEGSAEFNTQLPYTFLSGRVAHYLRRIERDTIGAWDDPKQLEVPLRSWLRRHVAELDDAHWETRSRRPLRRAELDLKRAQGGWIRARLEIEPHFTHHGAPIVLTTDGRIDPLLPRDPNGHDDDPFP